MRVNIGVDVGGTKIAAGAVSESGELLAFVRKPTPATDPAAVAVTISDCVNEIARSYEVDAVGIGAAGFISADRSTVVFAPNLSWRNEPLARRVEDATGHRVIVENDANAAAWGEYRFGAAAGSRSAVVVTVGTGIGGGIITDGNLLRGSGGFGAEIGHIIVNPGGHRCGCGLEGCWEAQAAGPALVRYARQLAENSPAYGARLLELAGSDQIDGVHVTRAAQEGDAAALEAFAEISRWMGQGMAALSAVLDPDIFVLAGGVGEAGDILANPVRQSFEGFLTARDFRKIPTITIATLGNNAGIIGAADLTRH